MTATIPPLSITISTAANEHSRSLPGKELRYLAGGSNPKNDCPVCQSGKRGGEADRTGVAESNQEVFGAEKQKTNVKAFINAVKKYTDMQELDAAILREFIDHIEVSHTDKKSKTREITIVYNFIGAFDFERAKEKAQNTIQKQQRTA